MFCNDCGKEISDKAISCPYCGCQLSNNDDSGNIGYLFLGCCIPIVGIILYFVWKNEKPKNAKKCLTGFFINIGIGVAYYLFWVLIFSSIMISI